MIDLIITIWFFVLFIPGIYVAYTVLQSINWEKILKKGKTREFRILYIAMSVILSFLFASAFCEVIQRISDAVNSISL